MAKKNKCPEEVSEKWAIPYADFLTLLLCLFIALYAIKKSGSLTSLSYAEAFAKQFGMRILPFSQTLPSQLLPAPVLPKAVMTPKGQYLNQELQKLKEELAKEGLEKLIKIEAVPQGVKIILQEAILFDPGHSSLKPTSIPIVDKLFNIVNKLPNPIEIDGYTDNTPIHTLKYPSNWELSTDRAASVARYFISKGMDPTRIKIAGYGEYRPLVPNTTPENKAKNRRVEITILNMKGSELTTLQNTSLTQSTQNNKALEQGSPKKENSPFESDFNFKF